MGWLGPGGTSSICKSGFNTQIYSYRKLFQTVSSPNLRQATSAPLIRWSKRNTSKSKWCQWSESLSCRPSCAGTVTWSDCQTWLSFMSVIKKKKKSYCIFTVVLYLVTFPHFRQEVSLIERIFKFVWAIKAIVHWRMKWSVVMSSHFKSHRKRKHSVHETCLFQK